MRGASGSEAFSYQAKDSAPVFGDGFDPGEASKLWEINPAETKPGDQDVYAVTQGLVRNGRQRLCDGLRAVRFRPAVLNFRVCFVNGHLQRSMGHGKRYEFLPMLRTGQPSSGL